MTEGSRLTQPMRTSVEWVSANESKVEPRCQPVLQVPG